VLKPDPEVEGEKPALLVKEASRAGTSTGNLGAVRLLMDD